MQEGFTGTVDEWLESLIGPKGDTGLSAYQLAINNGITSDTESNWLASLKGDRGPMPTITVGSTTTSAAGTNASVSVSNTSTGVQLSFTIPRGADGNSPGGSNITIDTTLTHSGQAADAAVVGTKIGELQSKLDNLTNGDDLSYGS